MPERRTGMIRRDEHRATPAPSSGPETRRTTISPKAEDRRPRGRTPWILAVAVVIVVGVAVPYGLLAGRDPGLEVVYFWLLFGLVVIGLVFLGVDRWRDEP